MAATVVPNLVTITDSDTDSEWTISDGLDTEIFVQGIGSESWNVAKNAAETATYDYYTINGSTTLDMSGTDEHVYVWLRCNVAAVIEPIGGGSGTGPGAQLTIASAIAKGGNTDGSKTWGIAGSDTWTGGWKCFVQDINASSFSASGVLDYANIAEVRITIDASNSGLFRNAVNTWIDAVRHGTGLTAYGSTSFDFGDIAVEDEAVANRYGIIQEVDGVYFIQGRLTIGDSGSTNACNFDSQDEIVIFTERPVTDNLYQINFVGNGTGSTDIDMGIKVGTGDTAVGRNGTLIQAANSNVKSSIDFDDGNVNTCKIYGSTFRLISGGVVGTTNTTTSVNYEFIGNTIDQSGQFDPVGAFSIRNCVFSGTTDNDYSGSALLWNSNIDIKNSSFLANIQTGGPGESDTFINTNVNTTTEVITITGHTYTDDDVVEFSGTDIPAPLVVGTNYYVVGVSGDDLQVSATLGGTVVNLSDQGTGTHTIATVDSHGVEHPATGTVTYYDLTFSGNDYDVDNASTGLVTINVSGGSTPSYENTGGGASTSIVVSVSVGVHVEDTSGTDLQYAQVYIQKTGTAYSYTSHASNNVAAGTTFEVVDIVDTDLPQSGWLHVYDESENTKQNYRYQSWTDKTFTLKTPEVTGSADSAGTSTTLNSTGIGALDIEEGDTIRNTSDTPIAWAIVDEISTNSITTTPLQGGTTNEWQDTNNFSVHKLAVGYNSSDLVDVPLFNGQTDATGDISTTFGGTTPASITVRIRSNQGDPKYLPYDTSGSIEPDIGYSLTAVMAEDVVAE